MPSECRYAQVEEISARLSIPTIFYLLIEGKHFKKKNKKLSVTVDPKVGPAV